MRWNDARALGEVDVGIVSPSPRAEGVTLQLDPELAAQPSTVSLRRCAAAAEPLRAEL
jgi:hypothetical protein